MYLFFRDLAIILIAAKFFGLIARKLKAPKWWARSSPVC